MQMARGFCLRADSRAARVNRQEDHMGFSLSQFAEDVKEAAERGVEDIHKIIEDAAPDIAEAGKKIESLENSPLGQTVLRAIGLSAKTQSLITDVINRIIADAETEEQPAAPEAEAPSADLSYAQPDAAPQV
jgi:hypothetical protein